MVWYTKLLCQAYAHPGLPGDNHGCLIKKLKYHNLFLIINIIFFMHVIS